MWEKSIYCKLSNKLFIFNLLVFLVLLFLINTCRIQKNEISRLSYNIEFLESQVYDFDSEISTINNKIEDIETDLKFVETLL